MTMRLEYDDTSAALYDGEKCLRAFGWPRDGGHVWETLDFKGNVRNSSVCYRGSHNTIISEDAPIETAKHLAEVCGVPEIAIVKR